MRLLSFLTAIENSLLANAPAKENGTWEATRMVNFHHRLARLTLTPLPGNTLPGGTIFLQAFSLADGSLCLKANLNWRGSDLFPVLAVYSTPKLNWAAEASRIAHIWLEGPREVVTSSPFVAEELHPLVAAVG